MSSHILLYPVFLPLVAGAVCLLIPKKGIKEGISLGVSLTTFILALIIFTAKELVFTRPWLTFLGGINFSLRSYHFSSFILVFLTLFGFLISLYSAKFMSGRKRLREYYAYLLWTIGASSGAILANNFILFLVFWGALALLLYGLLSLGSYRLATKGIFIMGAADFALILGALFLYKLSGTFQMSYLGPISLTGPLSISAFILLMIGAIAKAGTMPFHTWIPDAADEAPSTVMALLPASLDKLLGIYLLFRICTDFFKFTPNSGLATLLMIIGSFTIVAAVMMALIQREMKRLIAYLNVSAAGYMIVGIATANPVGIAGGLFYLLSTSIWTSCLFLNAGAVDYRLTTTEFARLGGLAKTMPVTFLTTLVAGLSISGVPPFNGFFSKWMVYQGIVELGKLGRAGNLWILWLLAAMFGSALTLASFMKLIHATFLGTSSNSSPEDVSSSPKEVGLSMSIPMVILASSCVIFGIFAYHLPLRLFILASV
ncbi:MAG: proton-conducting transporter membrane subunit, partial [bacterium]